MELDDRLEDLKRIYHRIALATRESAVNLIASNLPIIRDEDGEFRFLRASSIACQALVPEGDVLHEALIQQREIIHRYLPEIQGHIFWQPIKTFHLNVIILRRLSRAPLLSSEREEILSLADQWLKAVAGAQSYAVRFEGLLVTPDGTILALGYPECQTPWKLRDAIIDLGFPDQQKVFHITLGRIVSQLAPDAWRELVHLLLDSMCNVELGIWTVQEAILIVEQEGFLHRPRAYEIVKRLTFP